MRRIFLIVILLALALPAAAAGKYYKWVDQNGVTHYDTTPPKDQQTTEVRASARGATAADAAATEATTESEGEATAAAAPTSTADPQACESARANLQTLQTNPKISRVDPVTNQRVDLSQAEVDAAYTQAEQDIAKYCEQAAG